MVLELPIARITAFVGKNPQSGNTASVVRLETMLDDDVLQALARRNGDSETAYLLDQGNGRWLLRWFTPGVEVDLCGHATMASGQHLFDESLATGPIVFETLSGELTLDKHEDGRLTLDLPIDTPQPEEAPEGLLNALGIDPSDVTSVHRSRDLIFTVADSSIVRDLRPDQRFLQTVPIRGIIVTAAGDGDVDFVSRWFGCDELDIFEDPVTGSAHAALAPLWAERLNKNRLEAQQWSPEGGDVSCIVCGDIVTLLGRCESWLQGTVFISG
jgi:PhzF family phenazine biosynthesis protein